jgi:hypothetical protein
MNAIEKAIKDAEHAGYDSEYPFVGGNLPVSTLRTQQEIQHIAFLDPLFWQALGKARGWPEELADEFPTSNLGLQGVGLNGTASSTTSQKARTPSFFAELLK